MIYSGIKIFRIAVCLAMIFAGMSRYSFAAGGKKAKGGETDYTRYVNQFLGTGNSRWQIGPGPWMPMGMVKYGPDNQESEWKAGYDYSIDNVMGFTHIHDWTMAGLLIMPVTGSLQTRPGPASNPDLGYRSRIDKSTERSKVGMYEVDLLDYGIHAELTATCRGTMSRFTYPQGKTPHILVDLHFPAEYTWDLIDARVDKVSDYEIAGWALSNCSSTGYAGENLYRLNFVIQFDKKIKRMDGWVVDRVRWDITTLDEKIYEPFWTNSLKPDFIMRDAGIRVSFAEGEEVVKVRTAISYVSVDQARLNLKEEIINPFDWNFEAVVRNQVNVWNDLLGRVEIETDEEVQKMKFYTNMYRALSARTTWNDVDGQYVDMYEKVRRTDPSKAIYSSDGFWGTHWNLNMFYNLITPEYASNWVNTLLEVYDKGGRLSGGIPGMEYFRVMPGQSEIPLIVSAYQSGIRDFDVERMYEAIYKQQTLPMIDHPAGGQTGNESYPFYLEHGYCALSEKSTWYWQDYVSNTMEYSYQDWCFAQYAKALGHEDACREFMKRSENWRNVFDKELGFVRPKHKDGSWLEHFDPYTSPGFCESNSWQYSFYVPHNLPGLIKEMGKDRFIQRLEEAFEISAKTDFNATGDDFASYPINHGNQSNMQASYLFNHAGAPWLTQKWTRAIQEQYYGLTPSTAYLGDEDQGQMSAWYVMSTIGLFQMDGGCSVEPYYELGSPRFNKVTIHLSDKYYGGKTFTIMAKDASRENKYIQSVTLNGKRIRDYKFPQKEVLKGGKLVIRMGPEPQVP